MADIFAGQLEPLAVIASERDPLISTVTLFSLSAAISLKRIADALENQANIAAMAAAYAPPPDGVDLRGIDG